MPPPHAALRLATLAAALFAAGPLFAADDLSSEEIRRGHRARSLLAKPLSDAPAALAAVENTEASARLRLVRDHPRFGGLRVLETDGSGDVLDSVKSLRDSGLYAFVEPDYIRHRHAVPDDPRFADQWALQNTGQSGGTAGVDIGAPAAWDIQRDAPDVLVAVIDSGVAVSHPDLYANVWLNLAEFNGVRGVDDDNNGYIDDFNGINGAVPRGHADANDVLDTDGHGTHVAGIVGAVGNNGAGISGVAWKVKILPLRFLGRSGGSVSASIACLDYAIARGAHIVNASYGSFAYSQAEYEALRRARDAGIVVVCSAGNDSHEISELPVYPAAYALDNIVAVAATTRTDRLANYSTYGSGLVDLAAPGSSILSLGVRADSPYVVESGTSMAAPHVAGALALLKQKFPGENYRALINRVLNSVDVVPTLENRVHTHGRLNLARALASTHTRPFNDDFARRAVVIGDVNRIRGSVQFATAEPGEPAHGGVSAAAATLWWSWTAPPGAGQLALDTAGSGFDSVVAVYTGSSLADLRLLAANDDAPDRTSSRVVVDVVPGTVYAIAVAAKPGGQGLLALDLVTIPVNDRFAAATILTGPSVSVAANNAGATPEAGEPKPVNRRGTPIGLGKTVWFKWTAPANHRYQISVTDDSIDPVVAVYTGTALGNLAEVAANDDSQLLLYRYDSLAVFNGTAGVTYHIAVDVSAGAGGRFKLSINDAEWQALLFQSAYASPALAPDGTLYALDNIGLLAALRPDGSDKWAWLPDTIFDFIDAGAVAVGSDGTLYFGTYFGMIYALAPDGETRWSFETDGEIWSSPALGADGTIYVKSGDDLLYALRPDGTLKWKVTVPGDTYSSPVIGRDGTLYVAAAGDTALYALDPADGSRRWRAELGATVYASPAIGADGTLYLGNFDGRFFAIWPDGRERWRFDTGSPLSGSAAIDNRGVVYFGSYDKKLYALDAATGAKRWDYATGDIIRSTCPLIADDGTIYIGSDDGFVHAVNPDGTLRRTYATGGSVYASPILAAGRLYVASTDAKIHAFEVGANLARSPWPMHRHNVRRTGRVIDPLPGMPTIATQPATVVAEVGTAATFRVAATLADPGTLSYQWRVDGRALPGATAATFTLASAQTSDVGAYSVVVTGPGGSVVSAAVPLRVNAAANTDARIVNLAVRTQAGTGDDALLVGFIVGGAGTGGNKPLLLRAVGPTLGAFGVEGALADPRLELIPAGASAPVAANDDWAGDPALATLAAQLGAFPLSGPASKDAVLLSNRPAGAFTVRIAAATGAAGTALAEIYDATPSASFAAATPRLINVSARTRVGTGGDVLIAGFAVGGNGSKQILLRAVGPTLSVFGVPGVLANPKLDLFPGGSAVALSANDDWGSSANAPQIAAAAARIGAFALPLESRDAALLVTLPPGSYTAQISGVNNATGQALVEVYEVP